MNQLLGKLNLATPNRNCPAGDVRLAVNHVVLLKLREYTSMLSEPPVIEAE